MSKIASVVTGEADESDSEEELSADEGIANDGGPGSPGRGSGPSPGSRPSQPPRSRPLRSLSAQPGVVVQGEASETDSDDDGEAATASPLRSTSEPATQSASAVHVGLLPLKLKVELTPPKAEDAGRLATKGGETDDRSPGSPQHPGKGLLPYDTLLHRRLRDRNVSLQADVYEAVAGVFHTSARELANANQMLARSQSVIQDVCHNLRVLGTDLKQIEQKLDAVNSCNNIPCLTVDLSQGT